MVLKLLSRQILHKKTLTFDPKKNGGHLLNKTNHLMKIEDSVSDGSQVINDFKYVIPVTLTFDPKINRDHLQTETNHSMEFEDSW